MMTRYVMALTQSVFCLHDSSWSPLVSVAAKLRRISTHISTEQLREWFEAWGAISADRVITRCGAGIAASSNALALTLLDKSNVAVYDGSPSEWTADPLLPLEKN